jgi:hypothetical protein
VIQTGWAFEYALSKPLIAMYAFHSYFSGQAPPGMGGIPPEHQTSTRESVTADGKRQQIRTYYLGDVKDDPSLQEEIENIYGVKE